MGTEAAKAIYKPRAQTAERVNAIARHRGLPQFRVRGLRMDKTIALWFALAQRSPPDLGGRCSEIRDSRLAFLFLSHIFLGEPRNETGSQPLSLAPDGTWLVGAARRCRESTEGAHKKAPDSRTF